MSGGVYKMRPFRAQMIGQKIMQARAEDQSTSSGPGGHSPVQPSPRPSRLRAHGSLSPLIDQSLPAPDLRFAIFPANATACPTVPAVATHRAATSPETTRSIQRPRAQSKIRLLTPPPARGPSACDPAVDSSSILLPLQRQANVRNGTLKRLELWTALCPYTHACARLHTMLRRYQPEVKGAQGIQRTEGRAKGVESSIFNDIVAANPHPTHPSQHIISIRETESATFHSIFPVPQNFISAYLRTPRLCPCPHSPGKPISFDN